MEFETVFDITKEPCPWQFPAIGIAFAVGGMFLGFVMRKEKPLRRRLGPWFIAVFGGIWTILVYQSTVGRYFEGCHALRQGKASLIEGSVEDFIPMPYQGHAEEHMTVGGVRFSYSDYTMTSCFKKTSSHGGPIRAGLYVRIHYLENCILKLEVHKPQQ
jgi:hypothetical protein